MTKKRIQELAEFFYSSNSSNDVPLRLSITTGQYSGEDLTKKYFILLMEILNKSNDLKTDLRSFLKKLYSEDEDE